LPISLVCNTAKFLKSIIWILIFRFNCEIVSGGALQIGKGIGKGIATGDGRAVVEGITKGASSVGGGIALGAESAVVGTADGLLSAGKGIFSGFKNIGQGIGGAITGKKPSHFQRKNQDNDS